MIAAFALLAAAPLSAPAPAPRNAVKPDFSTVTSRAAAEALAHASTLVPVLMFPAEFGGEDRAENMLYITPEAASARTLVIGTLRRFLADGLIDTLDVTPECKGDSFVPSRIVLHATHSGKPDGFNSTIEVW